jgi:8-oxo-dGTP pyrophosphatase MutT (NUDIX family)
MKEDLFYLGVKALIRNQEGKFLLLKLNAEKMKGKEIWDLPGGRIQKSETLEETLQRELQEEIGEAPLSSMTPFMMVLSKVRVLAEEEDRGLIYAVYSCEALQDFSPSLSQEHEEYGWFNSSQVAILLKPTFFQEFINNLIELDEKLNSFKK